jgi:signal transduction histidine kinase/DNA-binding NarL/FixJ family response regulator
VRALVVDDVEFDREVCRKVLESLSWEVEGAGTPGEAVRHLESGRRFDVVISDYDLKTKENGLDLLQEVQRRQPAARRILMSGLCPEEVVAQAIKSHNGFIAKPDTLEGWRRAVSSSLSPRTGEAWPKARNETTATSTGLELVRPGASARPQGEALKRQGADETYRLRALVELSGGIPAAVQKVFDRAVEIVSQTLDMEYTKILKLLPGNKEVLLVAGVGWKPGLVGKAVVSTGMDSQAGYTLASRHPVVAEDLRTETRFTGPALLRDHGVISGLSVTIYDEEGNPWGVFGAHTKQKRHIPEADVLFLRAIANVVGNAIAFDHTDETLRHTKRVLEDKVAIRTRMLGNAVDDLQAFNAMVVHDLRSPLHVVTSALDLIRREHGDKLDPKAAHLLGLGERATRQMREIIENLLVFAKATLDPVEMRDIDLTALARERWEQVSQREPARSVGLQIQEGLAAHADPRLIAIVLDNLLGNAFKFTRNNPDAFVEMGVQRLPKGGTAFFIRDNGAGFAAEHKARLFQPFERLHSPKEFEGTGIGLATVQRIIERHQGSVWAESPGPGQGATFYFRLLPAGLP